jgi:hypothetical protein
MHEFSQESPDQPSALGVVQSHVKPVYPIPAVMTSAQTAPCSHGVASHGGMQFAEFLTVDIWATPTWNVVQPDSYVYPAVIKNVSAADRSYVTV